MNTFESILLNLTFAEFSLFNIKSLLFDDVAELASETSGRAEAEAEAEALEVKILAVSKCLGDCCSMFGDFGSMIGDCCRLNAKTRLFEFMLLLLLFRSVGVEPCELVNTGSVDTLAIRKLEPF